MRAQGQYPVRESVAATLPRKSRVDGSKLKAFKQNVVNSKLALYALLCDIKRQGGRITAWRPSRATPSSITWVLMMHHDCVLKSRAPTRLASMFRNDDSRHGRRGLLQTTEYAMLLSWHIADELMPKLANRGFKGKFIIPCLSRALPRIICCGNLESCGACSREK